MVRSLVLAVALVAICPLGTPADIDVAVPAGTPWDWLRALPQGLLFESSLSPPVSEDGRYARPALDRSLRWVGISNPLRILTWDIANHVTWTAYQPPASPVITGSISLYDYPPRMNEPLHWMSMAVLLRALLHPAQTSRLQCFAHLAVLGESAVPALRAARSEASLREDCQQLLDSIGDFTSIPVPPASKPRERMLLRVMQDELLEHHPFDPMQTFGRRIAWFGSQTGPLITRFAFVDHAFLRRNAVLLIADMEPWGARDVLLRLIEESPDPITRVRALHGLSRLGGRADAGTLVALLFSARPRYEKVALIEVLGSMKDPAVLPELARLLRQENDPEIALSVLHLLARVDSRSQVDVVGDIIDHIAHSFPGARWKVEGSPIAPDLKDPPGFRGSIVRQLLVLAQLRCGREVDSVEQAVERIVKIGRSSEADAVTLLGTSANESLRWVLPYVRYAYLEALGSMDESGGSVLHRVLEDQTVETELRVHALRSLPRDQRAPVAIKLLRDRSQAAALRAFAFQELVDERHPAYREHARQLPDQWLDPEAGSLSYEQQLCHWLAIDSLGNAGQLSVAECSRILESLEPRTPAEAGLQDEVRRRLRDLVDKAKDASVTDREVLTEIDLLLDRLIEAAIRTPVNPENRRGARSYIFDHLGRRTGSLRVRIDEELVIESLVADLVGGLPDSSPNNPSMSPTAELRQFSPRVPLAESVLRALGQIDTEESVGILEDLLKVPSFPHRPLAALALGCSTRRNAWMALVRALDDPDRWVRLAADQGLRKVTGQDFFGDILYGPIDERRELQSQYLKWLSVPNRPHDPDE